MLFVLGEMERMEVSIFETCAYKNYNKIMVSIRYGDRNVAGEVEQKLQNIIGDNVRKYRLKRRLSQNQLSIRLETYAIYICRGSVSRIERHKRRVTDFELKALAEVLRVTVADMFQEGEEK